LRLCSLVPSPLHLFLKEIAAPKRHASDTAEQLNNTRQDAKRALLAAVTETRHTKQLDSVRTSVAEALRVIGVDEIDPDAAASFVLDDGTRLVLANLSASSDWAVRLLLVADFSSLPCRNAAPRRFGEWQCTVQRRCPTAARCAALERYAFARCLPRCLVARHFFVPLTHAVTDADVGHCTLLSAVMRVFRPNDTLLRRLWQQVFGTRRPLAANNPRAGAFANF
jgi:hypothetical protein